MYKPLFLVAILSLLGAGCASSTVSNQPSPSDQASSTPVAVSPSSTTESVPPLPEVRTREYEGLIDEQLAIHMSLRFDGERVKGEYSYDKVKRPLFLEGILEGNTLELKEMDAVGRVSGSFSAIMDENGDLDGRWNSVDGKKELYFSATILFDDHGSALNGRYQINSNQYVDIFLLANGSLRFQGHTQKTAPNSKELLVGEQAGTAERKDIGYIYESESDSCQMVMIPSEKSLDVRDNVLCGANDVTFAGIYQKAFGKVPDWHIFQDFTAEYLPYPGE